MAAEEDERTGGARGRTGCVDLDPRAACHVGDNVFIACPGSSAHLGLWGSLVYPSGFGTPHWGRRACDGSSNLPSPTTIVIAADSPRHLQTAGTETHDGRAEMASEDGRGAVQ